MHVREVPVILWTASLRKWNNTTRLTRGIQLATVLLILFCATALEADFMLPNLFRFLDPSGLNATYTPTGSMNLGNPFFQPLGTNGRSCATCHVAGDAFGLSAADAQARYTLTRGKDPLFDSFDGSTCPTGPVNNSLMLKYALVRVGLTVPPNQYTPSAPEYTITAVQDPYGCALVTDNTGAETVSVYRRVLPTTNLMFSSAIQFDGRESFFHPLDNPSTYATDLQTDIRQQALDAVMGHEQAAAVPTDDELDDIVRFETGLTSAQVVSFSAGTLVRAGGAEGGPRVLAEQPYYPGINDSAGNDPRGNPFNPNVFTIYKAWQYSHNPQRASIARGEQIFNTHPLIISDVPGLTTGNQKVVGSCSTCHDTPNVGGHSLPTPVDIGVSHSLAHETDPNVVAALHQLTLPRLPVFKLVCHQGPLAGRTFYTSDPGTALITGKCSDISTGKGMNLRGLAARAPYFDNGSAATLDQVVKFYNQRFQMQLTPHQELDLVHFLQVL